MICPWPADSAFGYAYELSAKTHVHCHRECSQDAGHGVRVCVGEEFGVLGLSVGQLVGFLGKVSPAACGQAS